MPKAMQEVMVSISLSLSKKRILPMFFKYACCMLMLSCSGVFRAEEIM